MALISDRVLNPSGNAPDPMELLVARGWGIVALPPERLGRQAIAQWMAGVADQAAEFRRHGMTVVALLDGAEPTVNAALDAVCDETIVRHEVAADRQDALADFLDGQRLAPGQS